MTAVPVTACGYGVFDYEQRFQLGPMNDIMMSSKNVHSCGVCRTHENLKVCNGCRAMWYCSVDHQQADWHQHRAFCKGRANASKVGMNGMTEGVKGKRKKKRQQQQTEFSLDRSVLEEVINFPVVNHPMQFQGSGVGSGSGRRRTSLGEPDLSTPIDSNTNLEASSQSHPRPENPSLVQVCPDSQTLEEGGFSPERFADVMQPLLNDLNKYGVCVVDDFLGRERAEQILEEVMALYSRGVFQDGQVVSRNVQDQARGIIRGDKITWVTGNENHCGNIGQLVSVVDTLIAKANHHPDSGELGKHNITLRTRAMVACYPGRGSHYVKHVDNPDGDGRCITAIYYINKNWQRKDGGVLRIYPEGTNQVADVEPKFDRMLFFWSDRRNPHEVLPATVTSRYAITVWYLDQSERERYIARVSRGIANT
ncbi:Egl nine 1 [Halocaridina rubra]|uniref:hypoxia-inducible factor-proline dioxygenase n=1 Tax=Halocaridina rubra TaxID=373956 RepID=A0AAN8X3L4_HALRR